MTPSDDEVRALAERYYVLVCRDHHKDRDCHWYVEKRWSYGEGPTYRAQHDGYCFVPWRDGEAPARSTYREALADLTDGLRRAIAEAETWE